MVDDVTQSAIPNRKITYSKLVIKLGIEAFQADTEGNGFGGEVVVDKTVAPYRPEIPDNVVSTSLSRLSGQFSKRSDLHNNVWQHPMHHFDNALLYEKEESLVWRCSCIIEKSLRAMERVEAYGVFSMRKLLIDEDSTTYLGISWPFDTARSDEVSWAYQNKIMMLRVKHSHRSNLTSLRVATRVLRH
jgi:hypothetical protein